MRAQIFEFGAAPWPDAGVLQLYMPVDLMVNPALAELVGQWRDMVRDAPVTLVDDAALHVTLDVVADRIAEQIPEHERQSLITALRQRLVGWPRYIGTAGSALATTSGVIVDISPSAPLTALMREVREVLQVREQRDEHDRHHAHADKQHPTATSPPRPHTPDDIGPSVRKFSKPCLRARVQSRVRGGT